MKCHSMSMGSCRQRGDGVPAVGFGAAGFSGVGNSGFRVEGF